MVTLLILSLLVVIAVSFLSSMSAEHQTADAYAASADAEQATRAAVDSATAMLAESFRDFPDSATVWDPAQTVNDTTQPANSAVYAGTGSNSLNNEGTDLYLRAVPSGSSPAYALALPHGSLVDPSTGKAYAANDPGGNNPSNLACETFVLPLISGVPNGQAQLVSNKGNIFPNAMKLSIADPAQQNWVDLNVRRTGKNAAYPNGDNQGFIGSPPGWTGGNSSAPKPTRAYWVNVKGSDGLITSRYAFWIDDESFRLNTSLAGGPSAATPMGTPPTQPPDNTAQPTPFPSPSPAGSTKIRGLQPSDLTLIGTLQRAGDGSAGGDAGTIMSTRAFYPGYFFPDPLAFGHAFDGSTSQTPLIDSVRYVTTNQSGALNLTRHGSQRLDVNQVMYNMNVAGNPPPAATTALKSQVDELVLAMEFHLPYFGQRFYRMSTGTDKSTLNAIQVPGSPKLSPYAISNDHSQIYYYKVAANIHDYVDADSQPTVVGPGGVTGTPLPSGELGDDGSTNAFWALGKESSPFLQEATVRYRSSVTTNGNAAASSTPKGHYTLQIDYYLEFWNMTDRDIYAAQQPAPNTALPNLGGATVWIRDQQTWTGYPPNTSFLEKDYSTTGDTLQNSPSPLADWQLDLANSVTNGSSVAQPNGVVFRAGTVTVITSDPSPLNYTYKESPVPPSGADPNPGPGNNPGVPPYSNFIANPANIYCCKLISGQRNYSGKVTDGGNNTISNGGIMLGGEFGTPTATAPTFSDTEISLVNGSGYLDVVRGAITKTLGPGSNYYANSYKDVGVQGSYNDYSFGGTLMGTVSIAGTTPPTTPATPSTPSETGDPRTNNEQLNISINTPGADGSHFVPSTHTLGSPNWVTLQPATASGQPWPDYYAFPTGSSRPNADASNAPAVNADMPLTSIGQLGDVFDPARLKGVGGITYSRGGGRTFKIGQHDDRYSGDPTGNASNNSVDNVAASNGWASWRLADIFDVSDPVEMPGRININGVQRDQGAALLAAFQGFQFQPQTAITPTLISTDPTIHGAFGTTPPSLDTTGTANGFSALIAQMKTRLQNTTPSDPSTGAYAPSGPFFERGELGELGTGTSALFGSNPALSTDPTNYTLVASSDMNRTSDHGREELFRRIAQLICTRGDTFTVYATGQSIVQPPGTTAATADTAAKKITGTQRMRVTFRLVPQANDPNNAGKYISFTPAYTSNADGTVGSIKTYDASGVTARFAKPDRYNVQILQAVSY